MNKFITLAIAVCFALGFALIIASKIPQNTLMVTGIVAVVIGVLLTAFVLYKNYKK